MVCLPNIFCPLAVYVDGALLWSPGMTELPPDIMPIMARERLGLRRDDALDPRQRFLMAVAGCWSHSPLEAGR